MKKILLLGIAALAASSMSVGAWTVPDETLHYSVNFKWGFIDANAGVATLATHNNPEGDTFTATLTGKSIDLLGHYYEVGDTITGNMLAATSQPVYTQHISSEAGEFAIETITYNTASDASLGEIVKRFPDGKVERKRISHYGGGLTLDLLAVFYYIRQIDYPNLSDGDKVTVNIFSGSNPETLTVTYNGTSMVNVNDQEQQAYAISLTFSADDDGQTNADSMDVTISTNDARVPLTIDGSLKFGRLQCRYLNADPTN